ncbi:MAG: histidinol-phosphate transaminase [Rhodocyclaceae bacterium]
MSAADRAPEYIRAISPYIPGKPISELAREFGLEESSIVKLASNENPLGMSPKARVAAEAALSDLGRYPDGNGFSLKQALSRKLGVGLDALILGNGSNDLLDLAARAFLGLGTSAVYSQHSFAVYSIATQAVGATRIEVPALAYGHDLPAMAAAIRADTRLVFIANPNNPTGTYLPPAQIEAFLERCPRDVIVILDEAYNEYMPPEQRFDALAWLPRFPNLVVLRTFSKIYGLAGLRIGYGVANPAVADLINRVRAPFNANTVALAAAEAALGDAEFLAESYRINREGMHQLEEGAARLGLEVIPSSANFLAINVGDALAVFQRLLRMGVIVRPIAGLPQWLRVTIGTPSENARFLEALAANLKG